MTLHDGDFTLQSVPEFRKAFEICHKCGINDKLAAHLDFIAYVDTRARRKISSPDGEYRAKFLFASLQAVLQPYLEGLEKGQVIEYQTDNGATKKIDIRSEWQSLKLEAGKACGLHLAITIQKLREILILKESAILLD